MVWLMLVLTFGIRWPFVSPGEMVRCASLLDHIAVPLVSNPGRLITRLWRERRCPLSACSRCRALGKVAPGDKPARCNHRRRRSAMLISCGFDALYRLSRRAALFGRDVPDISQSVQLALYRSRRSYARDERI